MQQGTAAMAQGNAFVAEANDPSAIYYNPAGINQLTRPEVYAATFLNYPTESFMAPDGTYAVTRPRFFMTGSFYAVYPCQRSCGPGVGVLFALWPKHRLAVKLGRALHHHLFQPQDLHPQPGNLPETHEKLLSGRGRGFPVV